MRAIAIAAVALVALAGCNKLGVGGSAATNSTNTTTTANAAGGGGNAAGTQTADAAKPAGTPGGATPASAPGPSGITLDRAYLLGHWTDNGDCGKAISFNQDGSFTNADGGNGLWNLDGDRLTMTGGSTVSVRVTPIDQNTITVINADGSLGRSTRC